MENKITQEQENEIGKAHLAFIKSDETGSVASDDFRIIYKTAYAAAMQKREEERNQANKYHRMASRQRDAALLKVEELQQELAIIKALATCIAPLNEELAAAKESGEKAVAAVEAMKALDKFSGGLGLSGISYNLFIEASIARDEALAAYEASRKEAA